MTCSCDGRLTMPGTVHTAEQCEWVQPPLMERDLAPATVGDVRQIVREELEHFRDFLSRGGK